MRIQRKDLPIHLDTRQSAPDKTPAESLASIAKPASRPDRIPETVQVENPNIDRFASAVVTIVPMLGLIAAAIIAWNSALHWQDLVVLGVTYTLTGLGITVGYHRLFTHGSFKTNQAMMAIYGVLGSAAAEGPLIEWVATHRRHHQYSDVEGDPHSPHVGRKHGFRGALSGLFYAHIGWVFRDTEIANEEKYARDLRADPMLKFIDTWFVLWVFVGLGFPFALGYLLTGSVIGGLTGLLWGGLVRIFLLHHATFSVNSLCHFFGRQPYDTGDESRNLAWLAIPTMGEAWHNGHHAFPTSARHGLGRFQVDISAGVIWLMEKAGLAHDVIRISPERQSSKLNTGRA